MTIRTLMLIVEQFLNGQNPQAIRNDVPYTPAGASYAGAAAPTSALRGAVLAVGDTSLVISVNGSAVPATQTTDEPLRAGQAVWVEQAEDGTWLVHGSAD